MGGRVEIRIEEVHMLRKWLPYLPWTQGRPENAGPKHVPISSHQKQKGCVGFTVHLKQQKLQKINAVRELWQWNHCQKHPVSVFQLTFWSPRKETSQFVSFLCQNCYLIPIEGSWTVRLTLRTRWVRGLYYRLLKGQPGSVATINWMLSKHMVGLLQGNTTKLNFSERTFLKIIIYLIVISQILLPESPGFGWTPSQE